MAAMNKDDPKRPVVPPEHQEAFDQITGAAAHWGFRKKVYEGAAAHENEEAHRLERQAYEDFVEVVKAMLSAKEDGVRKLMTETQIKKGWRDTFSTENPFCPCDLKSFTKAVHWAERRWAK